MNLLKDLFDKEILKYTLLPLVLSLVFWGIVFYFFGGDLLNITANYAKVLPYGESIANIINSAGWIVLIFAYYILSISTLGLFSSFFIDKIVLRINEKHYQCKTREVSLKDNLKGVLISLKSFFVYLIIFIFTFWILFIPVLNIFYQMFMWSILNKKPLVFDSSYLFFDVKEIEKKLNFKLWIVVFLTSLVYFIPILSWFGYTIQLIFVIHLVLKNCKG